jgi:hypothetical protein
MVQMKISAHAGLVRIAFAAGTVFASFTGVAIAGPPFVLDDPQPTDTGHYEIYAFATGASTRDGSGGEAGIDFNYGGAANLQLTAVLPVGFSSPSGQGAFAGLGSAGLGNIELAAKYKFLHQDDVGVDVAVFPRVFLPAGSAAAGDRHTSFLLPIWLEKDWGDWSAFGGGGCELNRGGDSRDFCIGGAVLLRKVTEDFHLGVEMYHQTADTRPGRANTSMGLGAIYDLSDNYHLLGYAGRGIQNASTTNQLTWYSSVLFTF